MICPLCDTLLKNNADKYYFICDTCGAYVKDRIFYLDSSEEKSFYETHNNDVNDIRYQNFTSPITNSILEKHTPEQLGLDYGCGTGPVISKQLRDKGYKVNLFDPYFYPDTTCLNYKYDYIFSCEVFEHFNCPKAEIKKLVNILKPNGTLLIMTHLYGSEMDFASWYYRKDPTHVFIYTKKTFQFIAEKFGLTLEHQTDRMIIFSKSASGNFHSESEL